jgi:hypothetical protein
MESRQNTSPPGGSRLRAVVPGCKSDTFCNSRNPLQRGLAQDDLREDEDKILLRKGAIGLGIDVGKFVCSSISPA